MSEIDPSATSGLAARRPDGPLSGRIRVPGDKSISHRAVMLGALAVGETVIDGLLEGEDVLATAAAMRAMGAAIERDAIGAWHINGVGVGGLREPDQVLDLGNSGTSTRLIAGLLASHPVTSFMTGDASLVKRPMARVTEPLGRMGARFVTRSGGRLPMALIGASEPMPIDYEPPIASAQVKSAVLLAGLNTPGTTTVIERRPTRDHTETMLSAFGASVARQALDDGGRAVSLTGERELRATPVSVPGDPSSAAFAICAALLVEGSDVTVERVGLNPTRAGLIDTLIDMGAAIEIENAAEIAGEPVGDVRVRGTGPLTGIDVPPDRAPSMIDEYPVLAMVAAAARGRTRMTGVAELRVKESDRLAVVAEGLTACGVAVETGEDWMAIEGCQGAPPGGATVASHLDHRIAMSFLTLGLATRDPVAVDDARPIATSFPGFAELINGLAAGAPPLGPVEQ